MNRLSRITATAAALSLPMVFFSSAADVAGSFTTAPNKLEITITAVMPAGKRYMVGDTSVYLPIGDTMLFDRCKDSKYCDDYCCIRMSIANRSLKSMVIDRTSL